MPDPEELEEFLKERGTIQVICAVGEDGARFGSIKDLVSVSHDTVSKRLRVGEEYFNLFTTETVPGERGKTHKWKLQYAGSQVLEALEEQDAVKAFEDFVYYRQNYEDREEAFLEWIADHSDEIDMRWETGGVSPSTGDTYPVQSDPDVDSPENEPLTEPETEEDAETWPVNGETESNPQSPDELLSNETDDDDGD